LAANHRPIVTGTDYAIWRRIHMIPFGVTIPEEEQDKKLSEKLRDELPGILAWAVRGCLAWQKTGLNPPAPVLAANDAYRQDMDTVGDFIRFLCDVDPKAEEPAKDLFASYKGWCEDNGEEPISKRALGMRLRDQGFRERRTASCRMWMGLKLKGMTR
jgi:putative DNA primase/helicase